MNDELQEDIVKLKELMLKLVNTRNSAAIPSHRLPPKPEPLGKIDHWIIWYDNGNWKRSREKSTEPNVYIQLPVYERISNPIVVFCYKNSYVCTVKLADYRRRVNLNVIKPNGWYTMGDAPQNIFIVRPTDHLVGYSIDSNGIEHVKIHAISDFTPRKSGNAQGVPFLPDANSIELYSVISAHHIKAVEDLIVPNNRRLAEAGVPLTSHSQTLKDEIEYLRQVVEQK